MKKLSPLSQSMDRNQDSRKRSSRGCRRWGFLLLALPVGWFGFAPRIHAVTPPPDGGYSNFNTAEGTGALFKVSSGSANTAIGFQTLYNNTTGYDNTASGYSSLFSNTTGLWNTAYGRGTMYSNTTGQVNTAVGYRALNRNNGTGNTASGALALLSNTTGFSNTANGHVALYANTTGSNNTADGDGALNTNTTGFANTAVGLSALYSNKSGTNNVAVGQGALFNANGSNSNNIALGSGAGSSLVTGSNNIYIGAPGAVSESNTIRLGGVGTQTAAYIVGVSGTTVAGGVGVIVDSLGHLGTVTSSARYKDAIKPMDKASEVLFALQPVTFRYKKDLDPAAIPQFGLVAEQVAKIDPDLVARDEEGKPYTVRYEAVNAMMLNEFLREHRKVEEQGTQIGQLEATVAKLQSELERQAAQLQKLN